MKISNLKNEAVNLLQHTIKINLYISMKIRVHVQFNFLEFLFNTLVF